ncbi:MATN2-like protein [Mya arenaria]|uniref:MATN2-like protein n=1 Tax=Mya arenaria TaxID=6604 RepID=A0ABY7EFF2_MYAAR|nr:MATN2-like protein [Mya arenaria]
MLSHALTIIYIFVDQQKLGYVIKQSHAAANAHPVNITQPRVDLWVGNAVPNTDTNECSAINGGCQHVCTNNVGSFSCSCNRGYVLTTDLKTCEDIDECNQTPFPCDQLCHNFPGSYECSCDTGYYPDTSSNTCKDVNECDTGNHTCDHICINTEGAYRCNCRKGFEPHGNGSACTDIDECLEETSQCSQNCTNTPGSYTCSCENGYMLGTDKYTCNNTDECQGVSCENGGFCIDLIGGYTCSCAKGYTGMLCEIDTDECQGVSCANGGFCIDLIGGYTCSCANGYTGMLCELDLNECLGFLNGGCEDECINTFGSFVCKCSGNNTLDDNGGTCSGSTEPSAFSKYGLVRQFLPRGCSTIQLTKCNEGADFDILLSSTSKWYRLKTDHKIKYTYGIVFVETNKIALPVSISGMEVVMGTDDFKLITGSLSRDVKDGVPYIEERTLNCWSFDITPRDVRDFLVSNSFLSSFFHNIENSLPDWLKFSPNGNKSLGVNDLQTDLRRGSEIQQTECKGAPLTSDRLYTVLKFGNSFKMSIYGKEITSPAEVSNKKFCIIVDVCQVNGGSVFLILPEESTDKIQNKFNNPGVYIKPTGLGFSLQKHIDVHAKSTHVQQWNGDEVFQYPVFQESNIWIGGDAVLVTQTFRVSVKTANVFLSIPSLTNIMKSLILEEWRFVAQAFVDLELTFVTEFGNQTIRGGRNISRSFCGRHANPAGIFMSVILHANTFLDAPVLHIIKPDINGKAYVFLASDLEDEAYNKIFFKAKQVHDLKHTSERLVYLSQDVLNRYQTLLSSHSTKLLNVVITTGQTLLDIIQNLLRIGDVPDIHEVIRLITRVWQDGWTRLQNDTDAFLDSLRENEQITEHNVTQRLKAVTNAVQNGVNMLISNVTEQAALKFKEMNGAGLRFKGDLDIFGLKIIGVEIEFVYSIDSLGACSRFERAYSVLKGENAIRGLGFASPFSKLGRFLEIEAGVGFGFAISKVYNGKFAVMLRVKARFFGMKEQRDLFITNKGVYLYMESNMWETYKAQLQIFAELGNEWNLLTFDVNGTFVADDDGNGSFEDGYLAALRRFTITIADEAKNRISKLQDILTKAQRGLTSAQNWLEDKKAIVLNTNDQFDDAVRALDEANIKLEDAKKPFHDASGKLREAQTKVDSLCKINECKKICIGGLICKTCHKLVWGKRVSYPCCKFTSCKTSHLDPICVGNNVLCRTFRAAAYSALENAKGGFHIALLAFDAAKEVVSAAQISVDRSRVVLDIAIASLDSAKLGLKAAESLLDEAKKALEAVKQVVKLGVSALDFVMKYGIENIIDVRNCGFQVTLSTHDITVFDVHCDVNAFNTGFKTKKLSINFKDIFQSLLNAAKETITSILNSIENPGRNRRHVEHESLNVSYKQYRQIRDTDSNATETFKNQTIDIIAETLGYTNNQTDNEYDIRTEIFLQKCIKFKNIHSFLFDTIQSLHAMTSETASAVINSTLVQKDLGLKVKHSFVNASLTDLGIDSNFAETEFNMSFTELTKTIDIAKANLSSNLYLSDVESFSRDAASMLQNQTDDANMIEIVNYWKIAMANVTTEYFNSETCVSFTDCAHYAVASLYEIVLSSSDLPNKNISLQSISAFEDIFLTLTSNDSLKILEVFEMSEGLMDHLGAINDANVFCSTPPTIQYPLKNETVVAGQTLHLACNATGSPTPTFTWFKNDEQITTSSTNMILTFHNVTFSDEGSYHCVASNLVTSLLMMQAYINVKERDETLDISTFTSNIEDAFPVTLAVILATVALVLAGLVVAYTVWRYRIITSESRQEDDVTLTDY